MDVWTALANTFASSSDPAVAQRALYALPHIRDVDKLTATLKLVLGLSNSTTATNNPAAANSQAMNEGATVPSVSRSGIVATAHAVPVAVAVSHTALRFLSVLNGSSSNTTTLGFVTSFVMQHWQQLTTQALGSATAWKLLLEVSPIEVTTPQHWQQLALALSKLDSHSSSGAQQQQQQHSAASSSVGWIDQRGRHAVLSKVWSGIEWTQQHGQAMCRQLPHG